MNQVPFPHGFDPTSSLLFLGAGFSSAATNVIKGNPPTAEVLKKKIKDLALLPEDDPSELSDLSTYAVRNGKDLFSLLYNLYTIVRVNADQATILSQPWLRIYTTNYDDAVEFFWKSKPDEDRKAQSYSTQSQIPSNLPKGTIIHLHGYIRECSRDNMLEQLVLSHRSYAQQRVLSSPWWDVFERDMRVARHLFFVGYDLRDFEPARYLTRNPTSVSKTHFVLLAAKSPVESSRLDEYGQRHGIGVAGFANECKHSVVAERIRHSTGLRTFSFVDLLKDNKVAVRPTPLEIQSLLTFGNFSFQRLLSTFPKASYVVPRTETINQCISEIKRARTLVIHSKIGNGKSVFGKCLEIRLTELGYSCFEHRDKIAPTDNEIDFINGQSNPVVFFDDYDTAYANMHLFAGMKSETRFVIEVLTSTLHVRYSEAFDRLLKPIARIDLNVLNKDDCTKLYKLLDEAGLAPREFKQKFVSGVEMRDIVISIFENADVIGKIDKIVDPIIRTNEARVVLFSSAILKAAGLRTDPGFVRAISNTDPYDVLCRAGQHAYEFVDFAHDRVEPHSALFSEFLLRRYFEPRGIVGAIFLMAAEAARRMNEDGDPQSERMRSARATLGALLRFTFLAELLEKAPERDVEITFLYENCRDNVNIQREPLFWLQYSIFMQALGRWDLAERHMETAYERGRARPDFRTYQLDTNSLGLLIALELRAPKDAPIARGQRLLELLDKSRAMIGEGNHRGHILKVLLTLEPFVRARIAGLSAAERVGLRHQARLNVEALNALPLEGKVEWGTEPVKESLQRVVALLAE